jgi:hypothetical protein
MKKTKPFAHRGSRPSGRCAPVVDSLEDRHLLNFSPVFAGPHPSSNPAEFGPLADGFHGSGPVTPGPFTSFLSLPSRDETFGPGPGPEPGPGPVPGREGSVSFGMVLEVSRPPDFLVRVTAPDGFFGLTDSSDRRAAPMFLQPPPFLAGTFDQAARAAPLVSILVDRPGPTGRTPSSSDLSPVAASAAVIIFLTPTAQGSGIEPPSAGNSTPVEVAVAAGPIGARLADVSRGMPTPGFARKLPTAPAPHVPGIEAPVVPSPSGAGAGAGAGPQEEAPIEAAPPAGADLISQLAPFDSAALDRAISKLSNWFEQICNPLSEDVRDPWYLLPVVTALVAYEAGRRWRARRRAARPLRASKSPAYLLRSFF